VIGVSLLLMARGLIAFTAWSSLAHAVVMGYQGMRHMIAHGEMYGVVVLAVIVVTLRCSVASTAIPRNKTTVEHGRSC
jgi:hypothetical protein